MKIKKPHMTIKKLKVPQVPARLKSVKVPKKLKSLKKSLKNAKAIKVLNARAKKLNKRQLMLAAPIAVLIVVGLAVTFKQTIGSPNEPGNGHNHSGTETYQEQLLGEVDTVTGAPRDGRDPATQKQTSLADAASNPTGAGQRTDNPASGVNGNDNRNNPGSTSDPNNTGLNSSGCYYEYGTAGQCIQAHAATNGVLTCNGVNTHGGFPQGVTYTKDRFNLDKNKNNTACEPGEPA